MKLRYVFSAPAMFGLAPSRQSREEPEKYKLFVDLATACIKKVKGDVVKMLPGVEIGIDVLFNAFVEKDHGEHLNAHSRFGLEKMYADSGGLQIVTLGKSVTPEIKRKIYATQAVADYAMCFDEIPTRSLTKSNTKNSRVDVAQKMFYPAELRQCARKTAENIREQVEIISAINDTTDVLYIAQGNNADDMVQWFEEGTHVLDDYSRIAGVALADTCIGNGAMESVEMFAAYNKMRADFGAERVKSHIHLLGIGCVNRLLPLFYCAPNLLPQDITVSFDSTSHSNTYFFGDFADKSTEKNKIKRKQYKEYFGEIVDYFHDVIIEHDPTFDRDLFVDHYVKHAMSGAKTVKGAPDAKLWVAKSHIVGTVMYQLFGFFNEIKQVMRDMEITQTPLKYLLHARSYDDAQHWIRNYGKYVASKRIRRYTPTLEDLL